MNTQQLDVAQEQLNRMGFLPKAQAQRLIDTLRKHLDIEANEKPVEAGKPKRRSKTQAE